jgi:hypothetical protein
MYGKGDDFSVKKQCAFICFQEGISDKKTVLATNLPEAEKSILKLKESHIKCLNQYATL